MHLFIYYSDQTMENKLVEPEPGVKYVVEIEENQNKQLSMIPHTYLIWFNLVISI